MMDWLETPLGKRVRHVERALAALVLDDVFGFDLVQVGDWGAQAFWLEAARTQHAVVVSESEYSSAHACVCAPLDALPFASDTIDALLLPHTLERVDDPYAVLREAERVLRPEGKLVICGFNPWSGWGIRRGLKRLTRGGDFPPSVQRMISEMRLRDWVALLGLDVDESFGYLGLLPTAGSREASAAVPRRTTFLSGAYVLKVHKRTLTMTAVRPKWRARSRVLVPAAEPTTRVRG